MAKKKLKPEHRDTVMVRKHPVAFLLNDKENEHLEHYIKKYKVRNKSQLCRETLMKAILKRLEEDAPTLFD